MKRKILKPLVIFMMIFCMCAGTVAYSTVDAQAATTKTSVTNISAEGKIYDFLVEEMGFNTAAACGILSNIYHESTFNPNAGRSSCYGICQWTGSRLSTMKSFCNKRGYSWKSLNGQLRYLEYELTSTSNGKTVYKYMKNVPNTAEGAYKAGYYWCYNYERPSNKSAKSAMRGNLAKDSYWKVYSKLTVSFEVTDGKISSVTKSVRTGSQIGKLPEPKRSGYTFMGWYTEKEGGKLVTESTKVTSDSDFTLYARWSKNAELSAKTLRSVPTECSDDVVMEMVYDDIDSELMESAE